jgi:hypothetical protein
LNVYAAVKAGADGIGAGVVILLAHHVFGNAPDIRIAARHLAEADAGANESGPADATGAGVAGRTRVLVLACRAVGNIAVEAPGCRIALIFRAGIAVIAIWRRLDRITAGMFVARFPAVADVAIVAGYPRVLTAEVNIADISRACVAIVALGVAWSIPAAVARARVRCAVNAVMAKRIILNGLASPGCRIAPLNGAGDTVIGARDINHVPTTGEWIAGIGRAQIAVVAKVIMGGVLALTRRWVASGAGAIDVIRGAGYDIHELAASVCVADIVRA